MPVLLAIPWSSPCVLFLAIWNLLHYSNSECQGLGNDCKATGSAILTKCISEVGSESVCWLRDWGRFESFVDRRTGGQEGAQFLGATIIRDPSNRGTPKALSIHAGAASDQLSVAFFRPGSPTLIDLPEGTANWENVKYLGLGTSVTH